MAPLLVANRSVDAPPVAVHACPVEALGALGPLLCLHAPGDPHLLSGWRRARALRAQVRLDSDGPHEALHFFDDDGLDCWRLHLLPDSDFLAWERLVATLPVQVDGAVAGRRFWRGKHCALPQWQACALKLHAIPEPGGGVALAAADVALSPLGQACARRIADGNRRGASGIRTDWAEPAWAR